ncbi:phosphate ABC transporter substrate-binding/OmpA family protein [Kangiella marina]|uniref:Phosphate ABC transporter substrate-binding/OmpA family protein n=1 Tax=Kangiella marina TaxID=1079178 RepID=A0ABP8IKB8_9GAMM
MIQPILRRLFATLLLLISLPSIANTIEISDEDLTKLQNANVLFSMKGSNTIGEKLAPALAAKYLETLGADHTTIIQTHAVEKTVIGTMADGSLQAIDIKAHGSSTGFEALAEKDTDIAMASRRVKDKERQSLLDDYGDLRTMDNEYTIAVDGLAVIIHPSLSIKQLDTQQLAQVFSGEITNWRQLGGDNQPIRVFARDDNSGTYDTFKSLVLKRHNVKLSQYAKRYESSGELSQQVSSTFGAIGFVALPYVNDAKAIAVAEAGVALSFKPNKFTVSTEDYVLSRRLYLYHPSNNPNPHAKDFMQFVLENQAQTVVEDNHLISLKVNDATVRFNRNYPPRYLNMIRESKRLSITFHFDQNLELDNKGKRDLDRLVDYVKNRRLQDLFIFGFSAESGDLKKDKQLSEDLANQISDKLKAKGVTPFYSQGYGSRGAIASNATANGKAKNQRVEVWVGR